METNEKKKSIINVVGVSKTFKVGIQDVQVLKDVNFQIQEEDFVIIYGPSGSGKSTILHTILGLEPPTSGTVIFLGEDLYGSNNEDDRSSFRKEHIGMVYQQPNWVKSLSVKENVAFPLLLLGMGREEAHARALQSLTEVGLHEWENFKPTELSGGQQQRVALARALINNPQVIIADEPTGNLDYENGQKIMQIFSDLNSKQKKTIIMVTHDLEYLPYSKTAVNIFDGTVDGVYSGKQKEDILHKVKLKRGHSAEESTSYKDNDKAETDTPSENNKTPQEGVNSPKKEANGEGVGVVK